MVKLTNCVSNLTKKDKYTIYALYKQGVSQPNLARKYSLTRDEIRNIINRIKNDRR